MEVHHMSWQDDKYKTEHNQNTQAANMNVQQPDMYMYCIHSGASLTNGVIMFKLCIHTGAHASTMEHFFHASVLLWSAKHRSTESMPKLLLFCY